jgi:hypothetical protein
LAAVWQSIAAEVFLNGFDVPPFGRPAERQQASATTATTVLHAPTNSECATSQRFFIDIPHASTTRSDSWSSSYANICRNSWVISPANLRSAFTFNRELIPISHANFGALPATFHTRMFINMHFVVR